MKHTKEELSYLQAMPLNIKVSMTKNRIREWVDYFGQDGVYISFSGGKDSTVLMDIIRNDMGLDIPAMFVDVPTQFPELKEFVKTWDNVDIVRPKISFMEVCEKYGFPMISKEVSECVWGARKYLKSLQKELDMKDEIETGLTERNGTERNGQNYRYWFDKVCGCGKYAKSNGGGYDNKYRKLRGIGNYTKRTNEAEKGRQQSEISDHVGDADKRTDDKGEYP